MATQELLTRTLVELADNLVDDFDVVDLLSLLTDRCVEVFGVSDAGLMLAAPIGGSLRVLASSSATMRDLELYELQASEGPCLDCYYTGEPVVCADLSSQQRWPRFTPAALAAGFLSVSAQPMRLRGTTIGALNLFQTDRGGMDDNELAAARALADVATIAILQHQATIDARVVNDRLSQALNSRIIIEQAKGMLAERANTDVNTAFARLRHHARNHNLKLSGVAQDLLDGDITLDQLDPSLSP